MQETLFFYPAAEGDPAYPVMKSLVSLGLFFVGGYMIRHDWTIEELREYQALPLFELISQAHAIHMQFHKVGEIQICSLISIKTGGCPEDCKYCAQSSRYQTPVMAQPMMTSEEVINDAKRAIASGATRICLVAAWRGVRDNKPFSEVLRMVRGICELGVEVCCSLGMVQEPEANKLKEAGVFAYNHNLDSSEEFYQTIITTRTYQERLNTLDIVRKVGLTVCCGGILGMGETTEDRLKLLLTLSHRNPHPESVPVNVLSRVPGTPLENQPKVEIWEMVRFIAIARILMPKAMVRMSCGRIEMSSVEQTLCFFAGANSIFIGEKLLTVANTPFDKDEEMFRILGLKGRKASVKVSHDD